MTDKVTVPRFATEAEEADWWYDHRDELAEAFRIAAANGELRIGTAARLARERIAANSPDEAILLDPEDVSRAHALAFKRGLRYDAYLKLLVHDALVADEQKLAVDR